MSKHGKMYDETPSMEHDDKGNVSVKKAKKPENTESDKGVEDENFPVHVKHAHERHSMYARHSMEHGVHDAAKAGDKKEMHGRHESEMKAMHTRHEKEGMTSGAQSTVDEPIKKVEKEAKA